MPGDSPPPPVIYCFKDKIQLFWYRGPQNQPVKSSKPQTIKNINQLPPVSWILKVFLLQANTKLLVYCGAILFSHTNAHNSGICSAFVLESMAELGFRAGPAETCIGW